MEAMLTARLRSMMARSTDMPMRINHLCDDTRLVFAWYRHVPYGFIDVGYRHCVRMSIDDPSEIPVYVLCSHGRPDDLLRTFINDRTAVREYFIAASTTPDPLPDPPCTVLIDDFIGIRDDKLMCGVRNAVSRNRKLRELIDTACATTYDDDDHPMFKYLKNLIDLNIKVPLHVVTSTYELSQRNMLGTVYVMFPYYTTCATRLSTPEFELIKGQVSDRLLANDVLSLLLVSTGDHLVPSDFAPEFRRRSAKEVRTRHDSEYEMYVVIDLDLDSIADVLDRDGWTPEMQQFAREQLKIDTYHDYAFTRFLRARKDTPIGVL